MIKFQATLNTDGSGYWSDTARSVTVTGLRVPYINDEGDFGELCVYFDTRTWDVPKDGLIYTDRQFERELIAALTDRGFDATDVTYSEQGMQGRDYVSLDVGPRFLSSWQQMLDKVTV